MLRRLRLVFLLALAAFVSYAQEPEPLTEEDYARLQTRK